MSKNGKSKTTIEVETVDLESIAFDPNNYRQHPEDNLAIITNSITDLGFARSIVVDENNQLIAGEGATRGSISAGLKKAIIIDVEGDQVVAVRRTNLSAEQKERLKVIDNRANETSEWNTQRLANYLKGLPAESLDGTGFSGDDLTHLLALLDKSPPSLDDLESEHGAADDANVFSKVFAITLPLLLYKKFMAFWESLGETDEDRAKALLPSRKKAKA